MNQEDRKNFRQGSKNVKVYLFNTAKNLKVVASKKAKVKEIKELVI